MKKTLTILLVFIATATFAQGPSEYVGNKNTFKIGETTYKTNIRGYVKVVKTRTKAKLATQHITDREKIIANRQARGQDFSQYTKKNKRKLHIGKAIRNDLRDVGNLIIFSTAITAVQSIY